MEISLKDASTAHLSISGAISGRTVAAIHRVLEQYRESACRRLELDLSQVTLIDSIGAALLAYSQRSFEEHSKELIFSSPTESLMQTLRDFGLGEPLRIVL